MEKAKNKRTAEFHVRCEVPVSYTHLRKMHHIIIETIESNFKGPPPLGAVSYTHLDVYKRQGLSNGI